MSWLRRTQTRLIRSQPATNKQINVCVYVRLVSFLQFQQHVRPFWFFLKWNWGPKQTFFCLSWIEKCDSKGSSSPTFQSVFVVCVWVSSLAAAPLLLPNLLLLLRLLFQLNQGSVAVGLGAFAKQDLLDHSSLGCSDRVLHGIKSSLNAAQLWDPLKKIFNIHLKIFWKVDQELKIQD